MSNPTRARNPERSGPPGYPRLHLTLRGVSVGVAIAAHLAILLLLIRAVPPPQVVLAEPEAVTVSLVKPPPVPKPPSPSPQKPAAPRPRPAPAPPRPLARVAPPRRPVARALSPIQAAPTAAPQPGVSEAQLAGAATAGSGDGGGGGGRCDMVRRLQAALRRDPRVQAAAAQARRSGTRAVLVWNGDWIQSPGEEGKGLAGVRQAIALEVAFAPEACRTQQMHGLVLLTLNDAPGSAGLVLGGGVWRWSDLLQLR